MIESEILRIAALITAIGVIGSLAAYVNKTIKAFGNGIKCMLRAAMLATYYKHYEEDKLRQYEAENFEMQYEAYKALGGNSFIDKIHEDIKKWEVTKK